MVRRHDHEDSYGDEAAPPRLSCLAEKWMKADAETRPEVAPFGQATLGESSQFTKTD
jgi:hypothetical protein